MKILCISDQIDPLIYTNSLKERHADVDLVLAAGDLPLDYLEFIMSTLNKPLLFVFGNHHIGHYSYYRYGPSVYDVRADYEIHPCGASCAESRVLNEEGLIIAGLGGCLRYNNGENQFSNFQMKMRILKLLPSLVFNRLFKGRFLDILLTHASPLGIHDRADLCHQGFRDFLWFMRVFKPRYLVHGHIHLYDYSEKRRTMYHDTLVVNAFSHCIIDTGDRN